MVANKGVFQGVSLGPAMPYLSMPCWRSGVAAHRPGSLRLSSTSMDTLPHTPLVVKPWIQNRGLLPTTGNKTEHETQSDVVDIYPGGTNDA
jgi:hypothetical protein